ncbi:unnamed protein product [Soboliphyme baturini]|uniref:CUB domain-containing protein n=1 Tax=Soboliphyme baturini TaxID=241478 RepID=A0A183J5I9_9BILA|nr:unnamed protein product [Soboliphyme baturini]
MYETTGCVDNVTYISFSSSVVLNTIASAEVRDELACAAHAVLFELLLLIYLCCIVPCCRLSSSSSTSMESGGGFGSMLKRVGSRSTIAKNLTCTVHLLDDDSSIQVEFKV